jgi:hypothetical protein
MGGREGGRFLRYMQVRALMCPAQERSREALFDRIAYRRAAASAEFKRKEYAASPIAPTNSPGMQDRLPEGQRFKGGYLDREY